MGEDSVEEDRNDEGAAPRRNGEGRASVGDFFAGRSVLLTGATGFVGKVLLVKLLKSCPLVERVYVVVRRKKERSAEERIRAVLEEAERCGLSTDRTSKVVAVAGDISKPGIGLSQEDTRILIDSGISVAFHSAATVRFNEPLKRALEINVGGTQAVLRLCTQIPKMQVLVYVSTAYSNCNIHQIEEKIYDSEIPPQGILECAQWMTTEQMDTLAPQVMAQWPNSYTFSKFLAENLLKVECGRLPVAIFRPTIVVNSVEEPSPGWTSSLNGPAGVTVGSAMGLVRTLCCDQRLRVDIVPVDWVVNAAIVSAWDVAENKKGICVYNYSSGSRNPITWKEYMQNCEEFGHEFPPEKTIWYYSLTLTKRKWVYNILRILLHIWPAIIVDSICSIVGKQKRLLSAYEKVDEFADLSSFFTMHQWTFHEKNIMDMLSKISSKDKAIFPFNIEDLNWKHYFRNYMYGLRKFLLKEDPKSIPAAVKRMKRYHKWMESPDLLCLTASEPLTLEEEYEMQRKWMEDDDKCTFIILDLDKYEQTQDEIGSMIGDTNLFLAVNNEDNSLYTAEAEIMIAELWARRKHRGWEAMILMLVYGIQELKVQKYQVKIGVSNFASVQMFTKLGFKEESLSDIFQEITLAKTVDEEWLCWLKEQTKVDIIKSNENLLEC